MKNLTVVVSNLSEAREKLRSLKLGQRWYGALQIARRQWRQDVRQVGLGLISTLLVLILGVTSSSPDIVALQENSVPDVMPYSPSSGLTLSSDNRISQEDVVTEQRLQHSRLVSPIMTRHLLTGAHLFTAEHLESALAPHIEQQLSSNFAQASSMVQ